MRSEATNLIVLDGLHEEELGMDVSRWAGGLALVKDEVGEKHDRPAGRSNTCQHWAPGYPRFPNLGLQAQAAAAQLTTRATRRGQTVTRSITIDVPAGATTEEDRVSE